MSISLTLNDPQCNDCGCPQSQHSDGDGKCYVHHACRQFIPKVDEATETMRTNDEECEKVDLVIDAVRRDLLQRSRIGIKKYGVTLDKSSLTLEQFLQHQYEELLDAANYTKCALMKIRGEL